MTIAPAIADHEWQTADRLADALRRADRNGLTPSTAARKANTDTDTARRILDKLVARETAHTTGNGARTRYHAGRADAPRVVGWHRHYSAALGGTTCYECGIELPQD